MLRRSAIATLLAGGHRARGAEGLGAYFEGAHGTAVVMDAGTGKAIAVHAPELASAAVAPPGSTMKPCVLAALMERGRLRGQDRWQCPGELQIGGKSFACSHPPVGTPMDVRTALAYSCNCFVAHFAERFREGELAADLARYGFEGERHPRDVRLQALGVAGILVNASGLAMAYRRLSSGAPAPVIEGLEDAVEYGTAQRARIAGCKVAGKTGSVVAADGARLAWFAGFAPSSAAKVVVTVMLQGRSGGADAAPIAGRILDAHWKGML